MYRIHLVLILAAGLMLGGCATMGPATHVSSRLVDFLYPQGQPKAMAAETATLTLPVRVGIAFVPAQAADGKPSPAAIRGAGLNVVDQLTLLDEVARHFRQYPFVKTVEVIPSNYLIPGGGFNNLDAIAAMYDVDVIALVSYDQIQNTREGLMSILYWTLVGAYAIPGELNTTTTFVDTAVFDVASHKLLFRAPGISRSHDRSTPIDWTGSLRDDSRTGFQQSFTQMIGNLDHALKNFKQTVKDHPKTYKVNYAPGYTGGGGSMGWLLLPLAIGVLAVRRRTAI